jgi:hypothetical protein
MEHSLEMISLRPKGRQRLRLINDFGIMSVVARCKCRITIVMHLLIVNEYSVQPGEALVLHSSTLIFVLDSTFNAYLLLLSLHDCQVCFQSSNKNK